jgi:Predicted glycosyltransferases
MQKKVCVVPVCYNAYDDAKRFLAALEEAYKKCGQLDLDVVLADNSTNEAPLEMNDLQYSFNYHYLKNQNVGYFPAFNKAIKSLSSSAESYDFVVVCNVDLVVADDFFVQLVN